MKLKKLNDRSLIASSTTIRRHLPIASFFSPDDFERIEVAAYEVNMKQKDENSDYDDDKNPLTDYLEFIKDKKIESFWKGKNMREYISKFAMVELATPTPEKEDGSLLSEPTLFKPLFKSAETSKRPVRVEVKGDDTGQPQKQARINIDESKQTIAFVVPLSLETQKFYGARTRRV